VTASATGRRELTVTVVVAAVAAGLALLASGQTWGEQIWVRRPPLPPATAVVSGGEAAPLVSAAALVLLAAAGALLAVRGIGRVLVGLLMAVAGVGITWASARVLGGLSAVSDQLRASGVPAEDLTSDVAPAWPVVATVAGVLGIAAGLLAAVRGPRWPAMGRRYERGGAAPAGSGPRTDDEVTRDAWSALDRGVDPTVDRPGDPPAPTGDPAVRGSDEVWRRPGGDAGGPPR
jgi:uncharacterized membrane protein (TIGR02234 family)